MPSRFSVNGTRYYRAGDNPDKAYPSVTTILGKTASEFSKKCLRAWQLKNPDGAALAAQRGTAIHAACEAYIRGLPTDIPDEYRPYWDGLAKHLDKYDYFLWSEKPLQPQWKFCIGDDGISRIWSHQYGYAGCPDLIGVRNGVTILADFKTSVAPYSRYYPRDTDLATREEKLKDRTIFSGASKYYKCATQLAAYALASKETLGLQVDCAQILVSTPEIDQSFFLHGDDIQHFKVKWLQKVRKYGEIIEQEAAEQAELDAMAGECKVLQSA